MSIKIDLKGLDKSLEKFSKISEIIDQELTKTLNDDGIRWRDDVRANTPVDSGELRRSWVYEDAKKDGLEISIDLLNNLEYADHVEYGHRQEPGRYVPVLGKRLKADYVPGFYMLRNGTRRAEERLPASLREAQGRIRKRLSD